LSAHGLIDFLCCHHGSICRIRNKNQLKMRAGRWLQTSKYNRYFAFAFWPGCRYNWVVGYHSSGVLVTAADEYTHIGGSIATIFCLISGGWEPASQDRSKPSVSDILLDSHGAIWYFSMP